MRVVITGGAGFIGRHLAKKLLERGELAGADNKPHKITELVLVDIVEAAPFPKPDSRLKTLAGDIADEKFVKTFMTPDTNTVFHLAAVVSSAAEADFDLGMHVNFDGTRVILEACRKFAAPPRVVFASSVAVFGGDMPTPLTDQTALTPQTSYGVQKTIGELLVNDMSRKGFIDGRALRLPTIVVRPGKPNKAASTFASSIIREPLAGQEAVCPVEADARMWYLSPRRVVEAFIHAHDLPASAWGWNRSLTLPGIDVSVGDMVESLRRVAGERFVKRIRWEPDPVIKRIVAGWPYRFTPERALKMGFKADKDMDEIIAAHIEDELGGKPVD
jgi:nucleoside-diphosphate-sugar epimerase